VQPAAARTADVWLSPPSVDGGDRRRPRRLTRPSFPGSVLAFSQFLESAMDRLIKAEQNNIG